MRGERAVLDQIIGFARDDERVRLVLQNGSRVNPNVKLDLFCDYDVVFAVTDPGAFVRDQSWIARFGELIIMQQNDMSDGDRPACIFLMLFSDGVRIDLSFAPVDHIDTFMDDTLTRVLLDKDDRLGPLPPPTDTGYHTRPPSQTEYDETANEFWWCATNVAKGLWRDELTYSKFMMDEIVRPCLLNMLAWHIGAAHGWTVNSGKAGKWFKRFLPPELWALLEKTYPGADRDAIWDALLEMGRLFRLVGTSVAAALGYAYPADDDARVTAYLDRVRALPDDATDF